MKEHKYHRAKKFKEKRKKDFHEIVELPSDRPELYDGGRWKNSYSKRRLFGCSCKTCRNSKEKYNRKGDSKDWSDTE